MSLWVTLEQVPRTCHENDDRKLLQKRAKGIATFFSLFLDIGVCSSPSSVFLRRCHGEEAFSARIVWTKKSMSTSYMDFRKRQKMGKTQTVNERANRRTSVQPQNLDIFWMRNVNCFITIISAHFHHESWRFHKLHMTTSLIPETFQITTVKISHETINFSYLISFEWLSH